MFVVSGTPVSHFFCPSLKKFWQTSLQDLLGETWSWMSVFRRFRKDTLWQKENQVDRLVIVLYDLWCFYGNWLWSRTRKLKFRICEVKKHLPPEAVKKKRKLRKIWKKYLKSCVCISLGREAFLMLKASYNFRFIFVEK